MLRLSIIVKRLSVLVGCLTLAAYLSYTALASTDPLSRTIQIAAFSIDEAQVVQVDGLERRHTQSGAPDVPFLSEVVPIPDGMEPTVTVREANVTTQHVAFVRPVVELVVEEHSAESLFTNGYTKEYNPAPAIYSTNAYYPEASYTVEKITIEDQPHLRINLFPVRYNPATETLLHVGRVDIDIELAPTRDTWNGTAELSVCCDLPLNPKTARTALPVGQTAIKIEVDETGIYELTHAELVAIDVTLDGSNPNNFAMLTNGESVAFQVIGGGDNSFDTGDSIRFFGWPYDGPRVDRQYVTHNVFWLWANGSGNTIATVANPTGYAAPASFRSEITFEEDWGYADAGTNDWDYFDNEPDSWYWQKWTKATAASALYTQAIDVPNPASSGSDATLLVELLATGSQSHIINLGLSGSAASGSRTYPALGNYNVTAAIPAADLTDGTNTVEVTDASTSASTMYFNRVTIEYDREFVAHNDQLLFGRNDAAQSEFNISGFTTNTPVAWNVTDRLNPVAIAADVSGVGPYVYRVASDHVADAQFAASAESALLSPDAISAYDVIELTPATGADWVAVSHPDFISAIETLGVHRGSYSSIITHVVSVDDVINQYGYGLPTPNGIRDYMAHAVTSWPVAPRYLLLGGDASNNPREIACTFCLSYFEVDPTYVPTFMPYSDRFIGQQPSDHPYALLTGSDELADIGVGRFTVESLTEANNIVDKVIQYELNLLTPQPYMQDIIFTVDDDDPGAAIYCADSVALGDTLDDSLNPIYKCLPDGSSFSKSVLRSEIFNQINTTGTAILNYRGHGSPVDWAGSMLSRDHVGSFANNDRPFVIITADCLDGHFAWYNLDTIGETFLRRADVGSAAHWSASGLGFTFEYNVLHTGFYEGLFDDGRTTVGDAIVFAKRKYAVSGYDTVTGFSMNLQGDPAMQLMRPDVEVSIEASDDSVSINDTIDFTLRVSNTGQYPSKLLLTVPLPSELEYVGVSSSTSHTAAVSSGASRAPNAGGTVTVQILDGVGQGESAEFTLSTRVVSGAGGPANVSLQATGAGIEITTGDESDDTSITIAAVPTAIQLTHATTAPQPSIYTSLVILALLLVTLKVVMSVYKPRVTPVKTRR